MAAVPGSGTDVSTAVIAVVVAEADATGMEVTECGSDLTVPIGVGGGVTVSSALLHTLQLAFLLQCARKSVKST